MSAAAPIRRRRDDLSLQLTGLIHVRALLETKGAPRSAVALHADAIERVRCELARLESRAA